MLYLMISLTGITRYLRRIKQPELVELAILLMHYDPFFKPAFLRRLPLLCQQ